jgi:RimJ/RimL family protein N-acetyltransferase
MSPQIPVIETDRLMLRPVRAEDYEELAAITADPEVMRYFGSGRALSREETREWLDARLLGRQGEGLGCFTAWTRDPAELIGFVGLERLPLSEHAEVFYVFGRAHWGKGYATEAARALIEYALGPCGLGAVGASFDPENGASIRVARKVGMRFERYGFDEHGLFTLFYVLERR